MAAASIPTLEIEGPAGRVLVQRAPDDRIGDLADAIGLARERPLLLDGRHVARTDTLVDAGVVRGSRLDTAVAVERAPQPVAVLVCEAGPAAGGASPLGAGRHVVGRAPAAAVRIDDPSIELHHALVDVAPNGDVTMTQLTGRVPCRIGGVPVAGAVPVVGGATIDIGSSRLRLVRPDEGGRRAATVATAGNPWRRTIQRTPRLRTPWDPPPIPGPVDAGPVRHGGAPGLLAAAFTAVGSVVIAVVLGSPMFLVFGLVAVLASVGMWVAGRIGAFRDGRRTRVAREQGQAAFVTAVAEQRAAWWRHHVATTPGIVEAVTAATTLSADIWSRRADHGDAARVVLGWGPVAWDVRLAGNGLSPELEAIAATAGRCDDAPIAVDLGPGAALAVRGGIADAVVRAVIVQLAAWAGPADWCLVVVTADPCRWDWCSWLPHTASGGEANVVAADDAERIAAALGALTDGRHVVIVTDRPELLVPRTGPLRRFLATAASAAVVVTVDRGEAVPAMCRSVLDVGSIGRGRWSPDATLATEVDVIHVAGTTTAIAASVARALAGLHDPEDPDSSPGSLPASVTVGELRGGPIDDAIAIASGWRANGADPPPVAPLGLTADGVVEIDLVRDGPHALVAGTTGSGKSELLRTLVVSLAAGSSPEHLTFVLVDYKGGATFDACADLPHTVGLVTDLDDRLAERALASLEAELRRRERALRAVGASDLGEYRACARQPQLPRLVVVVDEFAALCAELPGFVPALVGVAQRGRSLGIHLVLATQRPAGVVSDDIRANTNLRLALRLHDAADARDVVGDAAPATFPRGRPGRVMLRLGPDDAFVFQAARSAPELASLVDSIRRAAALSDVPPPHRPWLPPLPSTLVTSDLTWSTAVGVVDVPAEQRRAPLQWSPAGGNLALIGARGTGTTTALRSLVARACRDHVPAALHVHVIDAGGDERLDRLADLAHCAAVIRPHERERLARMLRRLVGELERRCADGRTAVDPDVVLAIDAFPALRSVLDVPGTTSEYDALQRIVAEGAGSGIACVLTAERPGAVPSSVLSACADRWLFHLDDPSEAPACGVPAALVPPAVAGRIVVASTRLAAQLAIVEPPTSAVAAGGPANVGVLPRDVEAGDLGAGSVATDGGLDLVVGVDFESLGPSRLSVPDGEHVLVAGPPRSGRSTALVRLATSWREAHPDGEVVAIAPTRRSPLAAWPGVTTDVDDLPSDSPTLIVIDDAERVDDPDGALARLIGDRRPGVLVIAAARPDTLRMLYGHWTAVVRRSRTGLLMTGCSDVDGDLLGELLPRTPPIPPRPGLAWVVAAGSRSLAQVAR